MPRKRLWNKKSEFVRNYLCLHSSHISKNLNKEVFVKHEKALSAPWIEGVLTNLFIPMFWKITTLGHFRSTPGGRKCQKAHLHAKTFQLHPLPCFYAHPSQRNSLDKLFRKTAVFHMLAPFCHFQTVKTHIYSSRPFIWAYNKAFMTFHSKVTARTSSFFEKPLFLGHFGKFRPTSDWRILPTMSKGTSALQDLSFEPKTKSPWPSVQKHSP